MRHALELVDIGKSFGPTKVLDGVSLAVNPGEFVSLVGPSGCGKSTLLRIVAGLERHDAGAVSIHGARVDELDPRGRNIAMVFQSYALYPHMNVRDNISLPLRMARTTFLERLPLFGALSPRRRRLDREIERDASEVASQVRIEHLLDRKPAQLSGGQRQRVALARAMVREPSLFLMDEPLSNLDAQLRVHMRGELSDLHRRLGATFVYVTHDQTEAMTMSDRVAVLDGGRLAQFDAPATLYDRPADLAVARLIGTPSINLMPAVIDEHGAPVVGGVALPAHVDLPQGAAVTVGVRPEGVRIHAGASSGALPGTLHRAEHHGAERLVFVDLSGVAMEEPLIARASADAALPAEAMFVTFDPRKLHVFDEDGQRRDTVAHDAIRALRGAA